MIGVVVGGSGGRISAMTASDRASFSGASTTAMKSPSSMATLWWLPPEMRQTPEAIWVERTTTGGTVASCTLSGTATGSAATSAAASVTVISIELWPGLMRGSPWWEWMTVEKITPSKSW